MLSELSVDRFLADKPLALTMSGLEELRAQVATRLTLAQSAPREMVAKLIEDQQAAIGDQQRRSGARGVAVIPIRGPITQHAQNDFWSMLFGGTTVEGIQQALRAVLADDTVGKIVLDIDSPGGATGGISELAGEIYRARSQKPIIAVANSCAASAAYWIGASATEFYATPGAVVGSIGIFALHLDFTKAAENEGIKPTFIQAGEFKTELHDLVALTDDAKAHAQTLIDETYAQMVADIARGRGASEATVRKTYGQGRLMGAKAAKAAGMVDGTYTLEQALARAPKTSRNDPAEEDLEQAAETERLAQEEETAVLERRRAFQAWKLREFEEGAGLVGAAAGGSANGNQG